MYVTTCFTYEYIYIYNIVLETKFSLLITLSMYRRILESDINIFEESARLIIAGSSGSGKSYFVSRLIRKYRKYFNNVIVIGTNLENIEDLDVKRDDNFNPLLNELLGRTLVIFDDVLYNKEKLLIASDSYVRARHNNTSLIFLTQNIYFSNPNYRVISLNCTHIVIFRNRDIKQISCFGRTFLENEDVKTFVNLYKKEVLDKKYGYILVDFTKNMNDPLILRTYVADETHQKVFKLYN